mmetsp:Transcript_15532/g.28162  ORF Transcript_15532/g.28162 Transcript_15532/m.28162 type:complete len:374 (-) Transcript_15532:1210-2331(-)
MASQFLEYINQVVASLNLQPHQHSVAFKLIHDRLQVLPNQDPAFELQPFISKLKHRLVSLYLEARENDLDEQVDEIIQSKKFRELTEEFARSLVLEAFPELDSDLPMERIVSSEEVQKLLEELKGTRALNALETLKGMNATDVLMNKDAEQIVHTLQMKLMDTKHKIKVKALEVLAKFSLESVTLSSKLAGELFTIFTSHITKIRVREVGDFMPIWLKVAQNFGKSWVELPDEIATPMFSALGAALSNKQVLQEMCFTDPALVWFMQWTLRRSRRLQLIGSIDFNLEEPSLYLASRFLMFKDTSQKVGSDLKRMIFEAAFEGSERIAKCLSMADWDSDTLLALSTKLEEFTERKDWVAVYSDSLALSSRMLAQ